MAHTGAALAGPSLSDDDHRWRLLLAGLALGGALGVAGAVALVLTSDHETDKAFQVVAGGVVAPSFMGTGLSAWWRRPHNRTGLLMYAVGAAFLLTALKESDTPVAYGIGVALSNLFIAVLAHLLVAFPTGRLEGVVARRLVGVFYGSALLVSAAPVLFERSCGCTTPEPRNVLLIAEAPGVATAVAVVAALVASLSVLVLLQLTGAPTAAQHVMTVISAGTIAAVPFAFLAGLLRLRYTRADIVGDLVGRLQSAGSSIRETIADEPELVAAVSSAGALALDNERLQAELRARITELEESRARVLDAELSERRRIERDLHDGAQQQFVSLSIILALLDRGLAGAGATPQRRLLSSARERLDLGLTELRELARGIHPALLTERGLAPAIDALAARAPLEVRVLEVPDQRLPEHVETAAYFIVSESLTNAAKHASAAKATVRIGRANAAAAH